MCLAELFAEFLIIFEDLNFWKRKRARRKYEEENNLQKKIIIYPSVRFYIIALIVLSVSGGITFYFFFKNIEEDRTIEKLITIETLLEAEKKQFGIYSSELSKIIRNNPWHKNLLTDAWENTFYYESIENGRNYVIKSKGKMESLIQMMI